LLFQTTTLKIQISKYPQSVRNFVSKPIPHSETILVCYKTWENVRSW